MLGKGKTSVLRVVAAMIVAIIAFVCLCAVFRFAWAANPVEGDASKGGSVVQRDASDQESDSSAASGSSASSGLSGSSKGPDSARDTQSGDSVLTDASDGSAIQEEESPQPLDAEGNVINEGQVSDSSFLYDAAIADLAGADAYYDGQTVQVTGEAVGEAIAPFGSSGEGSDQVRVTLYEAASGSSVTVCMTAADASKIKIYGAYGKTGATLRVRGTFNLACKEHEGESDIHAETVFVVSQGSVHPDDFDLEEFAPGFAALACGFVLMVAFWRIKERSR